MDDQLYLNFKRRQNAHALLIFIGLFFISAPDFLRMIEEGQILVGPAILLGFWLAQNRDRLREAT